MFPLAWCNMHKKSSEKCSNVLKQAIVCDTIKKKEDHEDGGVCQAKIKREWGGDLCWKFVENQEIMKE